uniref:Uncharacterized protein n=1 Tax=Arundo donax TaxID=35708 RepID=A0A0A8Z8S5_ARUDO
MLLQYLLLQRTWLTEQGKSVRNLMRLLRILMTSVCLAPMGSAQSILIYIHSVWHTSLAVLSRALSEENRR